MDFTAEVINWYQQHKRDLPWRGSSDPYIIWLSEVILQQTRVEQGMPYFHRFAENYPTVADFASASEDEILKHWQGLGYYSRGRNMHHTAQMVMEEHAGYFPFKYDDLIRLKGIGEYTAAAISSFAANEPRAVVDGNVFRLLARYFDIDTPINSTAGKKQFTELANRMLDPDQPAVYNQAMMEFGSLQCRPRNPDCGICPLQPGCMAYRLKKVDRLPVKIKKQGVKHRYFNYVVVQDGDKILMNKRGKGDIWQNLYELPLIETPAAINPHELLARPEFIEHFGKDMVLKKVYPPKTHLLSHQKLHVNFIGIGNYPGLSGNQTNWQYVCLDQVEGLAQPKLIFEFFKNFF